MRRLAVRTRTSRATVQRILRRQLKLFPYKVQLLQRIKKGDKAKRIRFCKWGLLKWRSPLFRKFLMMSDEAQFHLDGTVNKQNCRVLGDGNPHAIATEEAQTPSITVWCGVCTKGILGPFFSEEGRHPVSVTASRYSGLLRNHVLPELPRLQVPIDKVWFQQ